jgi:hypothetical protein
MMLANKFTGDGPTMKKMTTALGLIVLCCASVLAEAQEVKARSTVKIENGQTVTLTGCVVPMVRGESFLLTNSVGKNGSAPSYMLVTDDVKDLSKRVGYRVRVRGVVSDRGDAKITFKSKIKEMEATGGDRKIRRKSEVDGDEVALPYLDVKSIKTLSRACS